MWASLDQTIFLVEWPSRVNVNTREMLLRLYLATELFEKWARPIFGVLDASNYDKIIWNWWWIDLKKTLFKSDFNQWFNFVLNKLEINPDQIEQIKENIANLKNWTSIPESILLETINWDKTYSIRFMKRDDWTPQFTLTDISDIIRNEMKIKDRIKKVLNALDSWNTNIQDSGESYEWSNSVISNLCWELDSKINLIIWLANNSKSEISNIISIAKEIEDIAKNIHRLIQGLLEQVRNDLFPCTQKISDRQATTFKSQLWNENISDDSIEMLKFFLNAKPSFLLSHEEKSKVYICSWEKRWEYKDLKNALLSLWVSQNWVCELLQNACDWKIEWWAWIKNHYLDIIWKPTILWEWFQATVNKRNNSSFNINLGIILHDIKTSTAWLTSFSEIINNKDDILELKNDILNVWARIDQKLRILDQYIDWVVITPELVIIPECFRWLSAIANTYKWKVTIEWLGLIENIRIKSLASSLNIALQQLTENAFQHDAKEVIIHITKNKNRILITVIDDWKWMTEKTVHQIKQIILTDKFDQSLSTRIDWNWVWILWVSQVIKWMEWWQITVQSEPYKWSTFSLTFKFNPLDSIKSKKY